jgi:hypothetical protein
MNPRGLVSDITEAGKNNINNRQQTNSKLCLQAKKMQKTMTMQHVCPISV